MGYVTLNVKRDFENVIKGRIMRTRDYPGLYGWAQCNHKCSYKRQARGQAGFDNLQSFRHG